jgi:hypothetical protein
VEASPALIDETVWYLYGFVANPIDPLAAAAVSADGGLVVVRSHDIACIAGAVTAADYQRPPAGASPADQLAWVGPRARRHHEVVRRIHQAVAVVPLKFGTLCADLEHVHTLLRRLREPIGDLLDRFEDRDEWTLRVTIDRAAVAALAQDDDPALVELRRQAARLADGQAFFARKRLAAATAARVADRVAAIGQQLDDDLAALGVDALGGEPTEPGSDRTLVAADLAVLVDRDRFAALDDVLAGLESEHAAVRLCCELRGPWPPYTFATAMMAADDDTSHAEGR